ncbi:MAG TPA: hypothetical protein VF334_09645 [Polyangia bacterium]
MALGLVLSCGAVAVAEPLPAKHVEAVRVSVASRSQHAIGLRALPAGAGWRLELAADGDSADVIDVTPGTPARMLSVPVVGRALTFDALRFAGGHVYRVQLRGDKRSAWSFVYLYPDPATLKVPAKKRGTERVRFDDNDAPATDEGAPARVDKGSL